MPDNDYLVDILVQVPAGPCNRYEYDPNRQLLRLSEVFYPSAQLPTDRGIVPKTMGSDGQPISVFLVVSRPNFPGAYVLARPIGVARKADGVGCVVAVPASDPGLAGCRDIEDVPRALREDIADLLGESSLEWQPAGTAIYEILAGRERATRAHEQATRGQVSSPVWQAAYLAGSGRASDVHTAAEHGFRGLANRFQIYLGDCLFPDERILMYVTRPRLAPSGSPLSFWRRESRPEGILVVTDRQLIWLEDAAPPDSTLIRWGYVARVTAVERIEGVNVESNSAGVRLIVTIAASGGNELLRLDFPSDRRELLAAVCDFLGGFVPCPERRAVRRLYPFDEEADAATSKLELDSDTLAIASRLRVRVSAFLETNTKVRAEAFVPASSVRPTARLVVVTERELVTVDDRPYEVPRVDSLGLASSVKLQSSLLGCSLEIFRPNGESLQAWRVEFDYPQREGFLAVFRAVQQILSQPEALVCRQGVEYTGNG